MDVFGLLFIFGATVTLGKVQYRSLAPDKVFVSESSHSPVDWQSCVKALGSPSDGSQWFVFDLGRRYRLYKLHFTWEEAGKFMVEMFLSNPVTFPNQPYQQRACPTGIDCLLDVVGRYVRIRKDNTQTNLTTCDFEISESLEECLSAMTFQQVTGSRYVGRGSRYSATTVLVPNVSHVDCASQCVRKPECQAFNFNVVNTACEMVMTTNGGDNITRRDDWVMNYLTYNSG